ncbi:hypothetical protein ANAPH2_00443 [Anaplasma phagocytophilum]|nr:hypothetical protein ANAPH2_00443 [Anaplasma phagocytophilum]
MYAIIEVKFFVCRNCDSAFGNLCHFATANQESMFVYTSPIPILGYIICLATTTCSQCLWHFGAKYVVLLVIN